MQWRDFVEEVDPDVVIGYNISNFDLPYLLDRAKALKVPKFPYLGRITGAFPLAFAALAKTMLIAMSVCRQTVCDEGHALLVEGFWAARLKRDCARWSASDRYPAVHATRVQAAELHPQLGLCAVPRRTEGGCAPFGHYRAAERYPRVAQTFGGLLFEGLRLTSPQWMQCRFSQVNEQDAYLPQRLMDKLMCFVNYTEMARVTGVPFNYLLSRGQSIKVLSQLFRKANDDGYVVPALKGEGMNLIVCY